MNPNYYGIETPRQYDKSFLNRWNSLEETAKRIEVKELDFSEFMLTSDEYEYFLPYFLKYQAF